MHTHTHTLHTYMKHVQVYQIYIDNCNVQQLFVLSLICSCLLLLPLSSSFFALSLSLSLSLCVSLCLCVSVSLRLCVSVSLCICVSFSGFCIRDCVSPYSLCVYKRHVYFWRGGTFLLAGHVVQARELLPLLWSYFLVFLHAFQCFENL